MKNKTVKALAGFLALLMLAGSLSACSGESFGSRLKNLFNPGGTHDGVTTVRPPRTTAPETTTQLSEIDEKMKLAPDLPGAKKVVKTINGYQRVTYVAEAGNPYGAKAGTYLGEFKKEVELEGKETGGVALIPSVVEKLLDNALAKIPEGEEKCMFFIPADISELNKDSNIKIIKSNLDIEGYKDAYLKVDFGGQNISVSNPVINGGFDNTIGSLVFTDTPFGIGWHGMSLDNNVDQREMSVLGNFEFSQVIMGDVPVGFGEKVTETGSTHIIIEFISLYAPDTIDDRILSVDKSPVFMIDQ